jgi:hypothetical protein
MTGVKMKIILIVFLSLQSYACSGQVEKNQASQKNKSSEIDNIPANPLPFHSQPDQPKEHISGGGVSHISGAPSSSHISG